MNPNKVYKSISLLKFDLQKTFVDDFHSITQNINLILYQAKRLR